MRVGERERALAAGRRRERDLGRDAVEPRRHRLRRALELGIDVRAASYGATRVVHAMRPSSSVPRSRRLAQRLRRRGGGERALRDQHRAAAVVGGRRVVQRAGEQPEQRGRTSARITNATSTSSSEKPRARDRGEALRSTCAPRASVEDRDTAGEPVDVDLELALAGGERERPPLLPPSG